MKNIVTLLILGGAIFLSPTQSRAESCILSCNLVNPNQKGKPASRAPKRPLVVDLVGHKLTVPSQVVGYTLTLESEEGDVYTYYITGVTLEIPQELGGNYQITISDENSMYYGTIEL